MRVRKQWRGFVAASQKKGSDSSVGALPPLSNRLSVNEPVLPSATAGSRGVGVVGIQALAEILIYHSSPRFRHLFAYYRFS